MRFLVDVWKSVVVISQQFTAQSQGHPLLVGYSCLVPESYFPKVGCTAPAC